MRLSRKGVKKLLWFLAVLLVLFIAFAVVRPLVIGSGDFTIIAPSKPAGYTKDELADLYWSNKEELTSVAEIVLANDEMRQIIINTNDDDLGIFTKTHKSFFSEPEWKQVEELFQEIRPYKIMLSLRNNDMVVYFDFAPIEVDGEAIDTSLYYFKNNRTMELYKGYSWVGKLLEHLDGYWYVGEHYWGELQKYLSKRWLIQK